MKKKFKVFAVALAVNLVLGSFLVAGAVSEAKLGDVVLTSKILKVGNGKVLKTGSGAPAKALKRGGVIYVPLTALSEANVPFKEADGEITINPVTTDDWSFAPALAPSADVECHTPSNVVKAVASNLSPEKVLYRVEYALSDPSSGIVTKVANYITFEAKFQKGLVFEMSSYEKGASLSIVHIGEYPESKDCRSVVVTRVNSSAESSSVSVLVNNHFSGARLLPYGVVSVTIYDTDGNVVKRL